MENVAVLSHIGDIDGVGAAALIKMKYRMPASNIFFTSHDLADLEKAYAGLKPLFRKETLFFITDMNPGVDTAKLYEQMVEQVNRRGGHVIWFDHHPWSDENLRNIAAECDMAVVGENKEMCATQLVHRFIRSDSKFADEFADMLHYIDLFLPTSNKKYIRLAEEYKLSIDYYTMNNAYNAIQRNLRHLASIIALGRFTDSKTHLAAMKFKLLNESRMHRMLNKLYPLSGNIVLGFSKQVDSTDACRGIIEKTGADVSVLVKTDHGHCSIRSSRANTVKLANAFGGGGHPHASGFSLDVKRYNFFKTRSDREKFARKLESAAKSVGLI